MPGRLLTHLSVLRYRQEVIMSERVIDQKSLEQGTDEFVTLNGEPYFIIREVDKMEPFFISIASSDDHWLFISSSGGLTAGRVSPENALFPYLPVDRIHESYPHTGPISLIRIEHHGETLTWAPLVHEITPRHHITRNLYKNYLGNKICFEEINHDFDLTYRYTWSTSERFGFIKSAELLNESGQQYRLEILDGLQNILPADIPRQTQETSSNLVDAYKWTELHEATSLAIYTLYSAISDKAQPGESLRANSVFCLGLPTARFLVSSEQIKAFLHGAGVTQEQQKRGLRGAYLANATIDINPGEQLSWDIVANLQQTQAQIVLLQAELKNVEQVKAQLHNDISEGTDHLARLMAASDGFQCTAEKRITLHHYTNVLFNALRGGTFIHQMTINRSDFTASIRHFNNRVFDRNQLFLDGLPETMTLTQLKVAITKINDAQLQRLSQEYLPISIGRRHGDPSRPWNHFSITLKDEAGQKRLSYQGNWRDIFQNWEALALSFPDFIENMIAKFVNASTIDGHNPYRITSEGIDWEIENPEDPWSSIGYWGDHQINYLLKLLEISKQFHPDHLNKLLTSATFSYANVPYYLKGFDSILADPKSTVIYNNALAKVIDTRVNNIGADGKLILDEAGHVYLVTLLEKLIVPLLSKLANFLLEGGIWLNTQRPEWNDGNNALVGHGVSMVTLNYMRRYVLFLTNLLEQLPDDIKLTEVVGTWMTETAHIINRAAEKVTTQAITAALRFEILNELGQTASHYRTQVYQLEGFTNAKSFPLKTLTGLLADVLVTIEHSINSNARDDKLHHSYNLVRFDKNTATLNRLYSMLEGQVAALSSGALSARASADLLEALFVSDFYRADQQTFMLYPDRPLPSFLEKNIIPPDAVERIPLLASMLQCNDARLIETDHNGTTRFNAAFINIDYLDAQLDRLTTEYNGLADSCRADIKILYEEVFRHEEFTGRSGSMFSFEGLGCIWWHMVAKLLLAVQESYFKALDQQADEEVCHTLASYYYLIRQGLGFNKTPSQYGAFPTDPYSHTPSHAGAQQPGMTGQVKEEIISRFGELGIRIFDGRLSFKPVLLRAQEFIKTPQNFRFLDLVSDWQEIQLVKDSLAFTWCQVPIVYQLVEKAPGKIAIEWRNGQTENLEENTLSKETSAQIFARNGAIKQISVLIDPEKLLKFEQPLTV